MNRADGFAQPLPFVEEIHVDHLSDGKVAVCARYVGFPGLWVQEDTIQEARERLAFLYPILVARLTEAGMPVAVPEPAEVTIGEIRSTLDGTL